MHDLSALIRNGDAAGVRELLDRDPEILNASIEGAPSPLLLATYYGRGEIAEIIRQFRPNLTLHEAAAVGDLHRLEAALATEDPNAFSDDGFTPLGYAAYFNHPDAVRRLLAAGADSNVRSKNPMGVAPLHSALSGGHKELARTLVEAGADVSTPSAEGWTPAHYVAHSGDVETARYLVERGARTDQPNREGKTPRDLAQERGHTELAQMF